MPRLPLVSGDEAIKAFRRSGWVIRRQVGSHVVLDKEGQAATLSIPRHRELDRGLLRRLVRDAGMTVGEFASLLRQRRAT